MKMLAKLLTNGKIKAGVHIPIELKEAQPSSIATCSLLEKTKRTNKPKLFFSCLPAFLAIRYVLGFLDTFSLAR